MKDERLGLPSASAFGILVECPGQPQLKASIPPQPEKDDEDAARGTRIHRAFETGSIADLKDEEEIQTYMTGVEHEKMLVRQWRIDHAVLEDQVTEGPREERLWVRHPESLAPLGSGQLDRHYLGPQSALILDLKSGWMPYLPPCERSWQLRFQAVALWEEHPHLQRIRVGFVRPKTRPDPSDTADYLLSDLEQSQRMVLYHLWLAEQPGAPRRAGAHCNFCPCKEYCPEAGAYALLPSVIANKVAPNIKGAVESLSVEDCVLIWDRSTVIGKILEEVKKRLKGLPEDEMKRLGLGFGKARTLSNIVNVKEAFERVKKEGVSEEAIWKMLKMPKGELQKTLQRELGWGADPAEGWIKGRLANVIEEKKSDKPLERV